MHFSFKKYFGQFATYLVIHPLPYPFSVFHEETPDVFYCPQEKPISLEGMIVKAKPLDALCEHEGRPLPEDYKSDCWNDVDETEYACQEKKRILLQLEPPGSENAIIDNYVPIFVPGEYKIVKTDKEGNPIYETDDKEESKRIPKQKHDF